MQKNRIAFVYMNHGKGKMETEIISSFLYHRGYASTQYGFVPYSCFFITARIQVDLMMIKKTTGGAL